MPRALVVFESMFGNGHRVAELVAEGLRAAGCEADVTSVTRAETAPDVDLLVLGGPTHALGMSRAATRASRSSHVATDADREKVESEPEAATGPGVREYLRMLRLSPGQAVAVYDTRANTTVPAGASRGMARRATALGAELISSARGFAVVGVTGPLAPGVEDEARRWGAELAQVLQQRAQSAPSESAAASRT